MIKSVERLVWNLPSKKPAAGDLVFAEIIDPDAQGNEPIEKEVIEYSIGVFDPNLGEYGQIVTLSDTGINYEIVTKWVHIEELVNTIEDNKIDTIKRGEIVPYNNGFAIFCGKSTEDQFVFMLCNKDGLIKELEEFGEDATIWLNRREANEMLL